MIYYLRCVDSAYYTPMSMKSGLIMINHILQRRFLSSLSPPWNCHLCPGWRAHLSGSPRGGWSPGHPSGWPADTLPPDSYRRLVLQVEDTRPREGGKGVDDGLWWARLEPRGPGSSAMIHLELLWRLIFSDDPFGASSDIDIGWIFEALLNYFDFLYNNWCFHMRNSCISLGKTSWFCLVVFVWFWRFFFVLFLDFLKIFFWLNFFVFFIGNLFYFCGVWSYNCTHWV